MSAIDFSDPDTIALLTAALSAAGVEGIEISGPSGQLSIVVSVNGEAYVDNDTATQPVSGSPVQVKAPLAGHLLLSHPSRSDLAGDLPRTVSSTDVLGCLRIGPVLLPVSAGRNGVLTKRLVEADALVGFGTVLFEIQPQ